MSELYIAAFHLTSCVRQVINVRIVYRCLSSNQLCTSSYECQDCGCVHQIINVRIVYRRLSSNQLCTSSYECQDCGCVHQIINVRIVYPCLSSNELGTSNYQCLCCPMSSYECCCRPTSSYQCLCGPMSSYQCHCRSASPGIPPSAVSSPPLLPWCQALSAAGLPSPSASSQTPGDCPRTRPSDADMSQGQTGPEREEIFFVFLH